MILDLKNYQDSTMETCAELETGLHDNMHMLLGMTSEVNELLDAKDIVNAGEELTDILWYVSNYCNVWVLKMDNIFQFRKAEDVQSSIFTILNADLTLIKKISILVDHEKKQMAYGKIMMPGTRLKLVTEILEALNDCYYLRGLDPQKCMFNNIAKLAKRYPDKFSRFHALNRDLDAERKILEQ